MCRTSHIIRLSVAILSACLALWFGVDRPPYPTLPDSILADIQGATDDQRFDGLWGCSEENVPEPNPGSYVGENYCGPGTVNRPCIACDPKTDGQMVDDEGTGTRMMLVNPTAACSGAKYTGVCTFNPTFGFYYCAQDPRPVGNCAGTVELYAGQL